MKILFLCHSFNSLSQKLYVDLVAQRHELYVEFDINDEMTASAVDTIRPDLIIAPFLKRAIAESIWTQYTCLIVHPGPVGDRGPSALDWAVLKEEPQWGVTVLQANEVWDGGDVWAHRTFAMRSGRKASLYRKEVTRAASEAVLEAIDNIVAKRQPQAQASFPDEVLGQWQGPVCQQHRAINWHEDSSDTVIRKINSGDGFPGTLTQLLGQDIYVYDAQMAVTCPQSAAPLTAYPVLGFQNDAICVATADGAIWIGYLRLKSGTKSLKLPAALVFQTRYPYTADWQLDEVLAYQDIRIHIANEIGYLYFDFYNGAMSTRQCKRLLTQLQQLKNEPIQALVLMGGCDFWSNGIDLNTIEHAESPADESLENIQAMNDLCLEVINTTDKLTCSVMRGNAGAGGVFLAMAADFVLADQQIVLNPHYKSMGNLYGSEYWTYLLPKRVGQQQVEAIMANRLPVGAPDAQKLGIVDGLFSREDTINDWLDDKLKQLPALLEAKQATRKQDEMKKPLIEYRNEEIQQMMLNFYGFDPSYHVARYHFVHKTAKSRTPPYLAPHRRVRQNSINTTGQPRTAL